MSRGCSVTSLESLGNQEQDGFKSDVRASIDGLKALDIAPAGDSAANGHVSFPPSPRTFYVRERVAILFRPFRVGRFELKHRLVYPPLTRCRASVKGVPQPIMAQYYSQRATQGGLIISEGTYIDDTSAGYPCAPGIFRAEQVDAWKPIVQAVHDKGSVFFCQLWHCGRAAHPDLMEGRHPIGASPIPVSGQIQLGDRTEDYPVPHVLNKSEIKRVVGEYATAAKNAIAAGFDGVEIHGANGYLIDQFTKSSTNKRTDEYGGSIENRARFALEMVDAVVQAVGADRVGLRLSPFTDFLDAIDETPYATFTYLTEQLNKYDLAYLHMVEPRMQGGTENPDAEGTLEPFRKVWHGPFIAAGGFKGESAADTIREGGADLVAIGRWWIANPDLPKRIQLGASLNKYNRATFYTGGAEGYIDYPFLERPPP